MYIKRVSNFDIEDFRERLMLEIGIPMKETEALAEAIPVILASLHFCRSCLIFKFFRGEESLECLQSKFVNSECDLVDDEITKIK